MTTKKTEQQYRKSTSTLSTKIAAFNYNSSLKAPWQSGQFQVGAEKIQKNMEYFPVETQKILKE